MNSGPRTEGLEPSFFSARDTDLSPCASEETPWGQEDVLVYRTKRGEGSKRDHVCKIRQVFRLLSKDHQNNNIGLERS
jgi:hypothetical protein